MSVFALTPENVQVAYTVFWFAIVCILLSFVFTYRDWRRALRQEQHRAVREYYSQRQSYHDAIDLAPPPVYAQATRRFAQTDHLDTQRVQHATGRR